MAIKALEQKPCEDCISRQAVNEGFKKYAGGSFAYGCVWDYINKLPSVTPKEKTGKWIYKQGIFGAVYCSKCDFELKTNNTKYCPNCGCQMRGDTDGKSD